MKEKSTKDLTYMQIISLNVVSSVSQVKGSRLGFGAFAGSGSRDTRRRTDKSKRCSSAGCISSTHPVLGSHGRCRCNDSRPLLRRPNAHPGAYARRRLSGWRSTERRCAALDEWYDLVNGGHAHYCQRFDIGKRHHHFALPRCW